MALQNMTVEDRLAEKLKSAEFAVWFGEDDLRELTRKALDKAFFQNRPVDPGAYNTRYKDPLIVEMATNGVSAELAKIVGARVDEWIKENPDELKRMVEQQIGDQLGNLIMRTIVNAITTSFQMNTFEIENRLRHAFGNH